MDYLNELWLYSCLEKTNKPPAVNLLWPQGHVSLHILHFSAIQKPIMQRGQLVLICCAVENVLTTSFCCWKSEQARVAMEEGAIRGKNRRSLIILTVLMCLVAVAILVIAVIMFSMIISRKDDDDVAEVSNLGFTVEGKHLRCNFSKVS